jgi:hypothetical protein
MLTLLMEDWASARSQVKASMIRASTVSWDDIGGLKDLKVEICFIFFFSILQYIYCNGDCFYVSEKASASC